MKLRTVCNEINYKLFKKISALLSWSGLIKAIRTILESNGMEEEGDNIPIKHGYTLKRFESYGMLLRVDWSTVTDTFLTTLRNLGKYLPVNTASHPTGVLISP